MPPQVRLGRINPRQNGFQVMETPLAIIKSINHMLEKMHAIAHLKVRINLCFAGIGIRQNVVFFVIYGPVSQQGFKMVFLKTPYKSPCNNVEFTPVGFLQSTSIQKSSSLEISFKLKTVYYSHKKYVCAWSSQKAFLRRSMPISQGPVNSRPFPNLISRTDVLVKIHTWPESDLRQTSFIRRLIQVSFLR